VKIWILGAGGLLGRALVDRAQAEGIPFLASLRNEVDVTDLEQLKKAAEKSGCTHVINCAAFTNVNLAEQESRAAYEVNATGAENVAKMAKEFGMAFVHLSTDYVFDGEKRAPYTETDVPNPLNVYGKSKWEGEQRVFDVLPTACIVRTSWVFGHEGSSFISSIIKKMREEEHVQAVEDQINRATFNRDLANALLELCSHSGLFHFANSAPLSRYTVAKDFYDAASAKGILLRCQTISPVSFADFPGASIRPAYSVLDTTKVTKVLGKPPRSWETILKEYLDYA
jgi:dTDP-4-dehydrorhamnose reductase